MALWIYPAKWVHDHKFFILNFPVKLLHQECERLSKCRKKRKQKGLENYRINANDKVSRVRGNKARGNKRSLELIAFGEISQS